ncbi:MAG: hypothetical protein AAF518_09770 [Spirochaetota bacterium]
MQKEKKDSYSLEEFEKLSRPIYGTWKLATPTHPPKTAKELKDYSVEELQKFTKLDFRLAVEVKLV